MTYKLDKGQDNVFTLSGRIVFSTAMSIDKHGRKIFMSCDSVKVILDDVQSFDSSIIAVLLSWQRFLIRNNINFAISVTQSNILMLIKSYNIQNLFTYFD